MQPPSFPGAVPGAENLAIALLVNALEFPLSRHRARVPFRSVRECVHLSTRMYLGAVCHRACALLLHATWKPFSVENLLEISFTHLEDG